MVRRAAEEHRGFELLEAYDTARRVSTHVDATERSSALIESYALLAAITLKPRGEAVALLDAADTRNLEWGDDFKTFPLIVPRMFLFCMFDRADGDTDRWEVTVSLLIDDQRLFDRSIRWNSPTH